MVQQQIPLHKNILRSILSLQAINSGGIKFVQKSLQSFDLYHQERKKINIFLQL
jgi:hypothetical protein